MSARRMPCKRCHHPRPVGTDGYCGSCAEILRQLKLPKSTPPSGPFEIVPCGASQLDAQSGPKCACGKPSAFEDGSCVDCAIDKAERVSSPVMAGDRVAPDERANAGVAGEESNDPITERSSKTPTLPPATDAQLLEEARNTRAANTLLEAPPPEPTMTEEDGSEPPDSIKEVDVAASEAPAP